MDVLLAAYVEFDDGFERRYLLDPLLLLLPIVLLRQQRPLFLFQPFSAALDFREELEF